MKRICKQCGREFELSESEISFYKSKGLELPKRCQACRNQNKEASGRTQTQDKERKSAKPGFVVGGAPGNNGNDRNNQSRIVVAAAAVIMIFAVFLIKTLIPVFSEAILQSDDAEITNLYSEPVSIDRVPDKPENDISDARQQPLSEDDKTEEQKVQAEEVQTIKQTEEQIQDTLSEIPSETTSEVSDTAYEFRKARYLTEHFQKHGEEFPYATEEEYLQGANNVINNPEALHKLEAEDGDDVYYVESTNEFVIVSTDGFIRTYFKADMDYYNRQ